MRKPRVLVVDDNKITTKLLARFLESTGYEALAAYDGVDCLEKVQDFEPDAIVLDVMMPRMDGYETAKNLKANPATKDIPIVITTALNDITNQLKAIESGADDFLSKPIEEKLLMAKVKILTNLHIAQMKIICIDKAIKSANNEEHGYEGLISEINEIII
jgi:two-component system cell cycle response regulator